MKWEYEFIEFYPDADGLWGTDCSELCTEEYESLIEALCAVGEEGWEMCGSHPASTDRAWTFKRPIEG